MQLDEALRQIADIRQQMARSGVFRGYRAITVGFSGAAGLAAAGLQSRWIASPEIALGRYLGLWAGVSLVCLAVAGTEMYWRARRAASGLAREQTLLAAEQFMPCIVVGALLTLCIYRIAPDVAWMLPGLWSLIFGMGILALCRSLPRQVFWVGSYYILCGIGCLLWGRGEHVLSPWLMAISFGGGQLLGAAILYWTLERSDVASSYE